MYCVCDKRLTDLMIYICDLEISKLYLFRDQTHYGRCVVACNKHVREMYELTDEELTLYARDVARAARAISEIVSPVKINYGTYGDIVSHLHCHLVPKQKTDADFGGTFIMSCDPPKHLTDQEYQEIIERIKSAVRE